MKTANSALVGSAHRQLFALSEPGAAEMGSVATWERRGIQELAELPLASFVLELVYTITKRLGDIISTGVLNGTTVRIQSDLIQQSSQKQIADIGASQIEYDECSILGQYHLVRRDDDGIPSWIPDAGIWNSRAG
ncbi:hypothetical protein PG987_012508 [Apiospora arundinis]